MSVSPFGDLPVTRKPVAPSGLGDGAGPGTSVADAILDATELLLGERGVRGLTTNHVARRAGVSVGSLYQYFPDKYAVIAEVARRMERRMYAVAQERLTCSPDLDARSLYAWWVELLLSPDVCPLASRRVLLRDIPPAWSLDAASETEAQLRGSFMRAAAERGHQRRPVDPELSSFVTHHAIKGVVEAVLLERPHELADPALRDELFALAWRYAAPAGASLTPPPRAPMVAVPQLPQLASLSASVRGEPRTAAGRQTAEAIVAAAAQRLVDAGIDRLSARAIAKEAGVSPATLYRYFDSIAAIIAEIASRRRHRDLRLVRDVLEAGVADPLDVVVRRVVRALVFDADDASVEVRSELLACLPRADYEGTNRQVMELAASMLAKAFGARAGEVRVGSARWMPFVTARALERTIEAAVLARRDLSEGPWIDELTALIVSYLRASGGSIVASRSSRTAPNQVEPP